jgi:hypothetical protein
MSLRIVLLLIALGTIFSGHSAQQFRELTIQEYRDKMTGGWIGQMAGVTLGAPTEFRWKDAIIPADAVPRWQPAMINDAFRQDDLYVEMTFLRSLEQYGLKVSIRQAGIDFANSGYPLWCANLAGRTNLRKGIAPPDSSHPQFNKCPNDIDYQIEADYSGLIAPGLAQVPVQLGEKFGRLMNYGDGMYAGQFMGALYAEAFFETDRVRLVESALKAIPHHCQYAEMVRDLVKWYREEPQDWEKVWRLIQAKYRENPEYQKASNGGIDCKINGAYVLLGFLWGEGDPMRTMTISCRGGQDSDCNPSSSAGVLFTMIGAAKVPDEFKSSLNSTSVFSHTAYDFPGLLDVCEKLTRQFIVNNGGKIKKSAQGDVLLIPIKSPVPSKLELSWAPGPIANSRFTKAEQAKITKTNIPDNMRADVEKFAPGWKILECGPDMDPGLKAEWGGRKNVLVTHPGGPNDACILTRKLTFKKGSKPRLRLTVANDPKGDFQLIVRAAGKEMLRKEVNKTTTNGGWLTEEIDLSEFAGEQARIEVLNQPTGWAYEAAYWANLELLP